MHSFQNTDGSLAALVDGFREKGALDYVRDAWPSTSPRAWKFLGAYALFEALLQVYLPWKRFEAMTTANGNVPVYKANGVQSLLVTIGTFFALWKLEVTTPSEVYALFP